MVADTPLSSPVRTSSAKDDIYSIRFLGDLQRLEVRPGDRFVLKTPDIISDDQHAKIQDAWNAFAGPGTPLLVIYPGFELGAIGKAEG
jgi:hypothetical protein